MSCRLSLVLAVILVMILFDSTAQPNPIRPHLPTDQKVHLDNIIDEAMQESPIVGQSIIILKNMEVVYTKHMGHTSKGNNEKVHGETIYPLYSITKLFTSLVIAKLTSQGDIQIDRPISDYLKSIPAHWRHIKVNELLAHSSGLPEFFSQYTDISEDPATIIRQLESRPMSFSTGTQTQYNQTNFLLIKLIIERHFGKNFEHVIEGEFVRPLQLTRTGFFNANDFPNDRVSNYYAVENGEAKRVKFPPFTSSMYAATGLNASAEDVTKWVKFILSGGYVPIKTLENIWQPFVLKNGSSSEYTGGWQLDNDKSTVVVGHYGGSILNVRHFYLTNTDADKVTVVHLSNGGMTNDFSLFDFSYKLAKVINPAIQLRVIDLKAQLQKHLLEGEFEDVKSSYFAFVHNPEHKHLKTESMLNELGWQVIEEHPHFAGELFAINLEHNPKSANAIDSYAESLYRMGELEKARALFKKALNMNPSFSHIPDILSEIDVALSE